MINLRQLLALHWIERLGTFERAAEHLNTTQSAISKRIQELEASTGLQLFDRSQRGARLTAIGEEMLVIAREMLTLAERITSLKDGTHVVTRRLRRGVTELTALTIGTPADGTPRNGISDFIYACCPGARAGSAASLRRSRIRATSASTLTRSASALVTRR